MANEKDKQKQATSQKGTTYTQVNDSTYNWDAPTGYGAIHLDPNSGGPWGTYHVYQGSAGPDVEKRLSSDGLAPHLQNISTLEFKYPGPWWLPIKEQVAPRWNKLLDKAKIQKNGGWLTKYQLGGEAPQQTQTEDRQLLALVTSAYKEVASGKLGESFMYVAQLLQDSQGAAKLDSLRTQIPELEEMLTAIEEVAFQQSAYMKKGGCAKKKTVKKGAKGCVPCKKLMRVGGKLINVLSDCEGNIISKHQVGGWIRKGNTGFNTSVLNEAYTKAATNAPQSGKTGDVHYYQDIDGSWKKQIWTHDGGRSPLSGSWTDGQALTDADQAAFVQWRDKNAGNIFKTGFTANWDNYSGTFDTEDNAVAAIGREAFDQGAFTGKTVRGVTGKSGNTWLGADTSSPTAQDYIDQYGFQGALQNEARLQSARLLSAKNDRRAASKAAWKSGLVGNGQLKAIRQEYKDTRDEINSQHRAQTAALLNRYTSRNHSTIGAQDLTSGTITHTPAPTGSSTGAKPEEYTILQRQGGWLNQF